jgi:hypothetical protein
MKALAFSAAIAAAMLVALSVAPAHAAPITYTFSGNASGDITGSGAPGVFTNQLFMLVFNSNTSLVDLSGSPFDKDSSITGTFTLGSFSSTLTATVESNSSAGNIDFYDAAFTNGLGLADPGLSGYQLLTSIGPLSNSAPSSSLTPTLASGTFTLGNSDVLQFTGDSSLTFKATVPEPLTISLFGAGIAGIAAIRRRKKVKQS